MSSNPQARPSSRVDVVQQLVRLSLTISYILLSPYPTLKWVLVVLYAVGCALVAAMNTYVCAFISSICSLSYSESTHSSILLTFDQYLPYYRFFYNQVRCVRSTHLSLNSFIVNYH
jgi:hypothetical protein